MESVSTALRGRYGALLTTNFGGIPGPIEVGDPQIELLGIAQRTVGLERTLET